MTFSLATVASRDGPKVAIVVGDRVHLLEQCSRSLRQATCLSIFQDWHNTWPDLHAIADALKELPESGIPSSDVQFLTPIQWPDKLMAVGANYSGHLKEMGLQVQKWSSMPFFFRPPKTSLVGPGRTVRIPRSTRKFDWECELAVVVGARLRHSSPLHARCAVAGYSVGLDMSCRDLIQVDDDLKVDLVRGKAQDTMAPCGPTVRPAAFIQNVDDLRITLEVNGERMIDASTSEMLYKVDEQLSIISEYVTIEPGDILFTGSPAGSAGSRGNRWLKPGDRIRAEIEQVGVLEVEMRADT